MRPYYSEYVRHMLRFYTRNLHETRFKSDVDKQNWIACDKAFKNLSDRDRDIMALVYGSFDTLPDNVYETAKKYSMNQNIIWDAMKDLERDIAWKRGLV